MASSQLEDPGEVRARSRRRRGTRSSPTARPFGHVVNRRLDAVALNPQPLPPHESVVGAQLLENVLVSAIIVVGGKGAGEGAARAARRDRRLVRHRVAAQVAQAQAAEGLGRGPGLRRGRPGRRRAWPTSTTTRPELQEALGAAAEQLAEAAGGR